jgi:hypothetical protein
MHGNVWLVEVKAFPTRMLRRHTSVIDIRTIETARYMSPSLGTSSTMVVQLNLLKRNQQLSEKNEDETSG